MKHTRQLWSRVFKFWLDIRKKGGKKFLVVALVLFAIFIVVPGSVLGYSLGLKYQGDVEYKNQNYIGAMDKYRKARSYWFLGKVSSRLGDRDLEIKIGRSDVMIRSGQNYLDGVKEFESGNFDSAKYSFSRVALNDPNYADAQSKINLIDESEKSITDDKAQEPKVRPTVRVTPYLTPTTYIQSQPTPTPTITVSPPTIPTLTPIYSDSACLAQKQSYVSEVDAAYLSWYDQWQAARAELSPCYASNPVPYCDNKMTEVNVEWQAKISATMKSYQDKLTQCSPEKRKFSDVSEVVSSSY